MAQPSIKLRGVYSKPWSKLSSNFVLSRRAMRSIGVLMVKEIVKAAKSEFRAQGGKPTPIGEPEGIPNSSRFFKSFFHKIVGAKTIEIWSSWEQIEQILEGRDAYPMPWLTRPRNVSRVPMKQPNGTVIARFTPMSEAKAWVHPGFARHDFMSTGLSSARQKVGPIVASDIARQLAKGNPMK